MKNIVIHGRWRTFLLGVGITFVATLLMASLLELLLRQFFPQPVEYYTVVQRREPGKAYQRWGIEVRFNSHGFRDREYKTRKDDGVIRIAVIGDSITYGTGVELQDTYHRRLESLLNSGQPNKLYEVIAFNQGAASTQWAMEVYEKVATGFEPDAVVLGFCLNDFLDYTNSGIGPQSARRRLYDFVADMHEWLRVQSHLYFLVFERSRRLVYKYILDRRVRTVDSWIAMRPSSSEFQHRFHSTLERLNHFNASVKARHQRFIVVVFPYEMQLSEWHAELYRSEYMIDGVEDAPKGIVQQMLASELQRLGIEFIDLLGAYQRVVQASPKAQLYFRELGDMLDWVHPNSEGHDVAAREIASYLGLTERHALLGDGPTDLINRR